MVALLFMLKGGIKVKEYLITVTSEITKHYMIDAASNEEAISTALDYFIEGTEELEEDYTEMNNVKVNIESFEEIDEDELKY